jgi:hypothetical protein
LLAKRWQLRIASVRVQRNDKGNIQGREFKHRPQVANRGNQAMWVVQASAQVAGFRGRFGSVWHIRRKRIGTARHEGRVCNRWPGTSQCVSLRNGAFFRRCASKNASARSLRTAQVMQ